MTLGIGGLGAGEVIKGVGRWSPEASAAAAAGQASWVAARDPEFVADDMNEYAMKPRLSG